MLSAGSCLCESFFPFLPLLQESDFCRSAGILARLLTGGIFAAARLVSPRAEGGGGTARVAGWFPVVMSRAMGLQAYAVLENATVPLIVFIAVLRPAVLSVHPVPSLTIPGIILFAS